MDHQKKEASSHGEPLGAENILKTREFFKWNYDLDFHVPEEVREHMASLQEEGKSRR